MTLETESAAAARSLGVLLPLALDRPYDYRAPPELALAPGDFVRVPLGRREIVGVVWGGGEGDVAAAKLKDVAARIDLPPLPELSRRFIARVAGYCMAPLGAVLRMAMSVPEAFRPETMRRAWTIVAAADAVPGSRMTPARERVIAALRASQPLATTELAKAAAVSPAIIAALAKRGQIEARALPPLSPFGHPDGHRAGPALSAAQSRAALALASLEPGVTLLEGVTGAGKTEVYFEAIAAALRAGRQVLVLLPEIALTAQWLERFAARFGAAPAQWHSDLTAAARRVTWRSVLRGEAWVVVGARSALFLPFSDLGLVIVDEEHDAAFKQEEGVVYQARDMAVLLAHLAAIPAVLASATPSLETIANVEAGRYRLQHLPERHGGARLPAITAVDLRRDKPPRGGFLAPGLRQALAATLAEKEQALLFLNRRGYAPLTLCRACGHRLQCPNCTAWLVEHRFAEKLLCHHCGHQAKRPDSCPACAAEASFAPCGPGIERIAEEVAVLFPEARRLVLASDTLGGPAKIAAQLRRIAEREIDIVIGTQVVAKGHHFPHLTLVGIVDADLGLAGGDLRAAERSFQLLNQVAGRAGRAERPGRVLVQTYDPGQAVMTALVRGDREGFIAAEMADRRQGGMPPFGRLAALILSSRDRLLLADKVEELSRARPHLPGVAVLGPAPAPLALLRGRHRQRFLIKTRREIPPQPLLASWLRGRKWPRDLRLQIDIDPYGFM